MKLVIWSAAMNLSADIGALAFAKQAQRIPLTATRVQKQSPTTLPHTNNVPTIAFVSFGDWGMPEGAEVLARTRDRIRSLPQVDFVSLLGDNFYGTVSDDMHKLFQVCKISPNIPHYAVLGNHDYRGHHQVQLDYNRIEPAWHMPNTYYAKIFKSSDVSICALFIDTEPIHTKSGSGQFAWMKEVLMSDSCQKANWRIVSGHRNIHTAGIYSKETRIKDAIGPIIREGKVHVYYSGHEHNMQLLSDDRTVYAIAGKINQGMKPIEYAHELLRWHVHEVPGFVYTVATPTQLLITMYGTDMGPLKSIRLG